jgi:hypothetical protein
MSISFSVISNLGNLYKFKAVPEYENRMFSIRGLEIYLNGEYIDASDYYFSKATWEKMMEAAYEEYRYKYSILFH